MTIFVCSLPLCEPNQQLGHIQRLEHSATLVLLLPLLLLLLLLLLCVPGKRPNACVARIPAAPLRAPLRSALLRSYVQQYPAELRSSGHRTWYIGSEREGDWKSNKKLGRVNETSLCMQAATAHEGKNQASECVWTRTWMGCGQGWVDGVIRMEALAV